jgi:3-phenylpropionate/trans-cinnamate dioxygenase ferredoxin subunit
LASGKSWNVVGPVESFPRGRAHPVTVEGHELVVCRARGEFRVVDGTCSHADYPLADGDVVNGAVLCPLHGALFDLDTGEPLSPPADRPIGTYPTRVDRGVLSVLLGEG